MKQIIYISLFLAASFVQAQETLSDVLNTYNNKTVPYISVPELAMPKTNTIVLDSREQSEFDVSHLKNALFVGYTNFNLEQVIDIIPNKDSKIVVYCSLGIRSEDTAEKLLKAGYTNVFNLYGGIFEWKNKGLSVYDKNEKETENVHVCNSLWSKWLIKGNKIYD
ncbi:rhodanese [Flavobacteriales bacterium 34_180_T64]|nr:rhodanese [Flavobacteriales bacterium 34_180_T64]